MSGRFVGVAEGFSRDYRYRRGCTQNSSRFALSLLRCLVRLTLGKIPAEIGRSTDKEDDQEPGRAFEASDDAAVKIGQLVTYEGRTTENCCETQPRKGFQLPPQSRTEPI